MKNGSFANKFVRLFRQKKLGGWSDVLDGIMASCIDWTGRP
jgi:hypothetical protein